MFLYPPVPTGRKRVEHRTVELRYVPFIHSYASADLAASSVAGNENSSWKMAACEGSSLTSLPCGAHRP